jgi:hypothetical protein
MEPRGAGDCAGHRRHAIGAGTRVYGNYWQQPIYAWRAARDRKWSRFGRMAGNGGRAFHEK